MKLMKYFIYIFVVLFVLTGCLGRVSSPVLGDACDDIFSVGDSDIAYNATAANGNTCTEYTISGDTFCGCIVTDTETGFVRQRDLSAPLLLEYSYADDSDNIGLGLWMTNEAVERNFCGDTLSYTTDITHSVNFSTYDVATNPDGHSDIQPVYTPDGLYVYASDAIDGMANPNDVRHSLYKVPESVDLGWGLTNFINTFTSNRAYPSFESGDIRNVYAASVGFYEIRLDVSLTNVGGDDNAIKILQIKELARQPTNDVTLGQIKDTYTINVFNNTDNRWRVGYTAMIEDTSDSVGPTKVLIMDHSTCKDIETDDAFACKTATLFDFTWTGMSCGVPISPSISTDGKFISFIIQYEEFAGGDCSLAKYESSPVYVVKNPFEYDDILDECDSSGDMNGYTESIDCTDLLKTASVYDLDTKCPSYSCCNGTPDCSYCTALGTREEDCSSTYSELNVDRLNTAFFYQTDAEIISIKEKGFSNDLTGIDEYLAFWRLTLTADTAAGEFYYDSTYPKRVQLVDYDPDTSDYTTTYSSIRPITQIHLADLTTNVDLDDIVAEYDLCPCHYDPAQIDTDSDRIGDACDYDPTPLDHCDVPYIGSLSSSALFEIGDTVLLGCSNHGSEGYLRFNGVKTAAATWTELGISVVVPDYATSGYIDIVNSDGKVSNAFEYTIDYSNDYTDAFYPTDTDEFGIKDQGGFGSTQYTMYEDPYLYMYASQNITAWDENAAAPIFTIVDADATLNQKPSKFKIYGDYMFVTGAFGLSIYKLSDIYTPNISAQPVAQYSNILLGSVTIKEYSGTPIDGVLVAAIERADTVSSTPQIFFFEWTASTETLELLDTYDGSDFSTVEGGSCLLLGGKKYVSDLVFDYYWPKLYVAVSNYDIFSLSCSFVYEFDISDLSDVDYIADERLLVGGNLGIPGSIVSHKEKIWVSIIGAATDSVAFYSLDASEESPMSLSTELRSCSVDNTEYACAVDGDCVTGVTGYRCPVQGTCECVDSYCQFCTYDYLTSDLTVLESQDMIVGVSGTSMDTPERHNVFMWEYDTTNVDGLADASTETANWAMSVSKQIIDEDNGYIYVTDEWVNLLRLTYTLDPSPSFTHHTEPAAEHEARVFSPGWWLGVPWEHEGVLYMGEHQIHSFDMSSLGNVNRWGYLDGSMYTHATGAKKGNNIVIKGTYENVMDYQWEELYIYVVEEDPITHDFDHVGSPIVEGLTIDRDEDGMLWHGELLWPEDNVVFTGVGWRGVYGLYVDPDVGTVTLNGSQPVNSKTGILGSYSKEIVSNVKLYDSDTLIVSYALLNASLLPEPEWGGIRFQDFSYPSGVPTTSNPAYPISFSEVNDIHFLHGYSVGMGPSAISDDNWITVMASELNSISLISDSDIVTFDLDDLTQMNIDCVSADTPRDAGEQTDCEDMFELYAIPYANFVPMDDDIYLRRGMKYPALWGTEYIVVPIGRPQAATAGRDGVYVFERSTFDLVYYYPGYNAAHGHTYDDYVDQPDPSMHMIPAPSMALVGSNGDLYIIGNGSSIYRMGKKDLGMYR